METATATAEMIRRHRAQRAGDEAQAALQRLSSARHLLQKGTAADVKLAQVALDDAYERLTAVVRFLDNLAWS